MPRLANRTPVCLIRHFKERYRTSNSARLAVEALERSRMVTYGEGTLDLETVPDSWLLFPEALDHLGLPLAGGPPFHDLTQGPPPGRIGELIIIDGTWGQARRMSHRIEQVSQLPRLTLAGRPGVLRARESPSESTTSTLESIGMALAVLDGPELGQSLLDLYDLFVARFRLQCGKK